MPTEFPHLSKAPIVEALLDMRVTLPPTTDVDGLRRVSETFRSSYPTERAQRAAMAKIFLSAAESRIDELPEATRGFMFSSLDDLYRVQMRSDGFTFNRLTPYTDWADVSARAHNAWNEYVSVASPIAVTRVAVRYINRFEVPVPVALEDYLVSPPELPEAVPRNLASFLWRWVVRDDETGIMCNLSQRSEAVSAAEAIGIVIDIDCYVQESLEPESERIWERLAQLRALKNRIFFGSITSRALERFR